MTCRLAVCESAAELPPDGPVWRAFVDRVRAVRPHVLLLNELPFGRWIADIPSVDPETLAISRRVHDEGVEKLGELGAQIVIGSRATLEDGKTVNQGFIWQADTGALPVHTKQFFPDEPGYYEARWYERGETHFRVAEANGLRVGFQICTEVMFNEWARHYGRNGANLIVVPRATERASVDRWRTAVKMAAIVSGCWVATSNRSGEGATGQAFGGHGWIVDPYGALVAETTPDQPVVCAEIDLSIAAKAQKAYPLYVAELPEVAPAT